MISQYEFRLPAYPRGFHIISSKILKHLETLPQEGILHLFIKHTSAGLTINENADPTVLRDFESSFNHIVKEKNKFVIITENLNPLSIYLCEFRNNRGARKLVATIQS